MVNSQLGPVVRQIHRLVAAPETAGLPDGVLLERFAVRHDEAAFEALLRRHGPLVWRVCRQALRDAHDAEDAFQAVFLVLARKARSVRKQGSLGCWLYGVASRVARRVRAERDRRRAHERQTEAPPAAAPIPDAAWRELERLVHEEVGRLPEKYRAPIVLCYLQEQTNEEAARQLGWPAGTVKARLARARELLRRRLIRRGVTVSMGVMTLGLCQEAARAAVPPVVVQTALRAAGATAAGQVAASTRAAALADGVLHGVAVSRLKIVLALALLVGVTGAGLFVSLSAGVGTADDEQAETGKATPRAESPSRAAVDEAGDPLPAEAIARLGTTRFRHGDPINFLAFTPEGKTLVSQAAADGIRVWDTATGRELRRLPVKSYRGIGGTALSPDGSLVAIGGAQAPSVSLWEVATGRQVRQLGSQPVTFLRFSPNGKSLITAGDRPALELWEVHTGKRTWAWQGADDQVESVLFSHDGKTLISSNNKTLCVLDAATGREVRRLAESPKFVGRMALSPDDTVLACIVCDETQPRPGQIERRPEDCVRLWDMATGKEVRQLEVLPGKSNLDIGWGLTSLAFAPDGKTLVTTGSDRTLRVWDVGTGKELRQFKDRCHGMNALAFAPDGKTLAVLVGMTIRLLDPVDGTDRVRFGGHAATVHAAAVFPDGRTVATASGDHSIRLWDMTTGREVRQLQGHEDGVVALALAGDGRTLLSGSWDKTLRVWDVTNGRELRKLPGYEPGFGALALSPDGKTLAVPGAGQMVRLLDAESGKELRSLPGHAPYAAGLAYSADGRVLVAWSCDRTVHVWDAAAGHKLRHFPFPDEENPPPAGVGGGGHLAYIAAASADGRFVAYGSQRRFLAVLDVATGKEVRRFTKLPDGVSAVAFSPDGRTVAWGGWSDPPIRLGELATGRERHHFHGHRGRVFALAFSADGRRLVSGTTDTTALVWDLTGRLEEKANWGVVLSPRELDACWDALAGADAAQAYRAVRRLAGSPAQAVPYLRQRLQPVAAVDEQRLARLIADLDAGPFADREQAMRELERLEEVAEPALRKALEGRPSAEVRRRAEQLLAGLTGVPVSGERLRTWRALEVLEHSGTAEARHLLAALGKGAPGASQTRQAKASLERLGQLTGTPQP